MLKVSNLSSGYLKKYDVINDISFEIGEGEVGVLIGENGSGKSTIFKTILGLIKPKSGIINIDDVDIINISSKIRAKYIAYVPQNVFMPNLTVYDVISMGRIPYYNFILSLDEKAKIDEIIKEFNLEKIKDKFAGNLSGGEKQLVAIARALAQEAKVIVFDEPTSNLDIVNEMMLKDKIRKIAKEKNISILISIHNLNIAYDIGDKFIFIKDGNLVDFGSKETFNEENLEKTFNKKCLLANMNGDMYVKFK